MTAFAMAAALAVSAFAMALSMSAFAVSALAVSVYAIILIILLWPLLFRLIRKLLPAKAETAVEHLSEELHHDLELDADGHPVATAGRLDPERSNVVPPRSEEDR